MYTALTMVMLVIFFMWLFDFRFKLGGFLLGLEFGPKESTTPTLSIEDISEFRKVVRELSIVKAQQNQLTIAARVENLSSNATVASITGGGDGHPPTRLSHKSKKVKKVKKETHIETEDSFEHISDESSSDTWISTPSLYRAILTRTYSSKLYSSFHRYFVISFFPAL